LGKTDNCQVAVSLSLATVKGSVPLDYRLYLPQEWAEDKRRCKRAGVPKEIAFATKGELAWAQIEAAHSAGIPRGTVLMDAGYGDEAALRDRLSAHGLPYAVGIRPATALWWGEHQPASAPVKQGRGRRRTRVLRDEAHQPIGVRELALALPPPVIAP
jgi:SRSO17 transposase